MLQEFTEKNLRRHPPKGFTIVGHSPSLTCFPGRTRNSFELILIFILSVMPAALFASVYLWGSSFRISRSGAQGVDQPIQFVRQRRVHVSLNYQPSTLNHSGGLFSVAPVLRQPARRHKPGKLTRGRSDWPPQFFAYWIFRR